MSTPLVRVKTPRRGLLERVSYIKPQASQCKRWIRVWKNGRITYLHPQAIDHLFDLDAPRYKKLESTWREYRYTVWYCKGEIIIFLDDTRIADEDERTAHHLIVELGSKIWGKKFVLKAFDFYEERASARAPLKWFSNDF